MNLTGLAAKTRWAQSHINNTVFLTGLLFVDLARRSLCGPA
jgi:hypothetical protein